MAQLAIDFPVFGQAIGFDQLTVSTTAVGFTASDYRNKNSAGIDARAALVTVEGTAGTNDIRWTCDGTPPTDTLGHILQAKEALIIRGFGNIKNFRAIRDGASDAVLNITFFG